MAGTAAVDTEGLKDLAHNIVRSQTNRYIKELLREHGIAIGSTKADFERNLDAAIDDGSLTAAHVEAWLREVEGWGNQHVYVYRLSRNQAAPFRTEADAHAVIKSARLGSFWQRATASTESLGFPGDDQKLELVSITYDDSLRFHWHNGTTYWTRTAGEVPYDKATETIDGFDYQFRAYRGRVAREVMRFEIRPQQRLAALFVPKAINSAAHQVAITTAKNDIAKVLAFSSFEHKILKTDNVIRNLDQALALAADDGSEPAIQAQSTRLQDDFASIEFAARATEGSYRNSDAVQSVRRTIVTDAQVDAFVGATGTFRFVDRGLGRVQLSDDGRIRLWSTMQADDVWHIISELVKHET